MRNRKVAIIDDDTESLRELEGILSMSGYVPVPLIDVFAVVDAVTQNKPDVILMKLRMPQKNGFELTDDINRVSEPRKIPVIAMSDFIKDELRGLLDLCGIKKLIKKPFQPLDIIWAIENEIDESN